ncbi:hypothetical protein Bca52824_035152 [Brassica carinata]|uniref:DUF287 domain-containing protein n=1 Tax=Brassica carinata TaxID=52824 RepID=A0A8X7V097_BRACI|nr:hypothetical protein Bca52824_035152 [Brassica carinata]
MSEMDFEWHSSGVHQDLASVLGMAWMDVDRFSAALVDRCSHVPVGRFSRDVVDRFFQLVVDQRHLVGCELGWEDEGVERCVYMFLLQLLQLIFLLLMFSLLNLLRGPNPISSGRSAATVEKSEVRSKRANNVGQAEEHSILVNTETVDTCETDIAAAQLSTLTADAPQYSIRNRKSREGSLILEATNQIELIDELIQQWFVGLDKNQKMRKQSLKDFQSKFKQRSSFLPVSTVRVSLEILSENPTQTEIVNPQSRIKTQIMLNRDDPKAKEDGSSSVGGEEMSMVKFSGEGRGDEMEGVQMEARNDEEGDGRTTQSHETESHAIDVSSFLEICDGVVPTSWVFTRFPIPLEAIPSLRNHFRESVNGARPSCPQMCKMQYKRKDGTKAFSLNAVNANLGNTKVIDSILVATEAEKELWESIGMCKESCWADDDDDAAVDRWTKIIQNGKQVFFQAEFSIDFEARTAQVEGPTIPAIGGPSNNAESSQAHADSVEVPGSEALKAMEGRLVNAVRDAMKEVNKKVTSLSNQLTLLEDEVKRLRVRVHGMSGDNTSDQDRVSDKESEEHGDDKESKEDGVDKESKEEDGGDKESEEDVDDFILDISKQVQLEHASGDDDVDDTLVMTAAAEELENKMFEKEKTEKTKTAKGCDTVRSPIGTRSHKMEEEAAQREAAQKRTRGEKKKKAAEKKRKKKAVAEKKGAEEAAEKKAAQKKAAQKKAAQKKEKKGGKKTV